MESPLYVLLNRISGVFDLIDYFDAQLVDSLLTRNLVGEIPSNEHVAIQRLDTGFDRPLDDRRFIDIVVFGEFPNVIRNSIGRHGSTLDTYRYKFGSDWRLCSGQEGGQHEADRGLCLPWSGLDAPQVLSTVESGGFGTCRRWCSVSFHFV